MDWKDVLERAAWTAIEAPPVVAVFDIARDGQLPPSTYLLAAGLGFAASAIKTIAKERLKALRNR